MEDSIKIDGTSIFFSSKGMHFHFKWDELRYVESCNHDCEFFFPGTDPFAIRKPLKEVEKILPCSTFSRCCKGFIVHNIIFFETYVDQKYIHYRGKKIPLTLINYEEMCKKSEIYMIKIRPIYEMMEAIAKNIFTEIS